MFYFSTYSPWASSFHIIETTVALYGKKGSDVRYHRSDNNFRTRECLSFDDFQELARSLERTWARSESSCYYYRTVDCVIYFSESVARHSSCRRTKYEGFILSLKACLSFFSNTDIERSTTSRLQWVVRFVIRSCLSRRSFVFIDDMTVGCSYYSRYV